MHLDQTQSKATVLSRRPKDSAGERRPIGILARSVMQMLLLGLGLAASPLAEVANAQIYRWTDDAGRQQFTQDLSTIPEPHRTEARQRWESSKHRINNTKPVIPRSVRAKTMPIRPMAPPDKGIPNLISPDQEVAEKARYQQLSRAHANRIDRARASIEQIKSESAAPATLDYSRRARNNRKRARWERNASLRENQRAKAGRLAKAQAYLAECEADLEEFLEEARRAGVPPGWVRLP